jgi:hypothetical protein
MSTGRRWPRCRGGVQEPCQRHDAVDREREADEREDGLPGRPVVPPEPGAAQPARRDAPAGEVRPATVRDHAALHALHAQKPLGVERDLRTMSVGFPCSRPSPGNLPVGVTMVPRRR